jgi:hypothetical protein
MTTISCNKNQKKNTPIVTGMMLSVLLMAFFTLAACDDAKKSDDSPTEHGHAH